MSDLKLDENLQPVLDEGKDWKTISEREEFRQWLRLESIKRLWGITSRYKTEIAENKIELTIRRIARQSEYISDVADVSVVNLSSDPNSERSGYKVTAKFRETDNVILFFDSL